MTRNERVALEAQLAHRLAERRDIPIMAQIFALLRKRPVANTHQAYLSDEDLYLCLNPNKEEAEAKEPEHA